MNNQRLEDDAQIVEQSDDLELRSSNDLALEQYHDNQQGAIACLCLVALTLVGMVFQLFALGDTPKDHAAANGGDVQPVRVARVQWGAR